MEYWAKLKRKTFFLTHYSTIPSFHGSNGFSSPFMVHCLPSVGSQIIKSVPFSGALSTSILP